MGASNVETVYGDSQLWIDWLGKLRLFPRDKPRKNAELPYDRDSGASAFLWIIRINVESAFMQIMAPGFAD